MSKRRTKAAAATPPLQGCVIALSGKFDSFDHSQSSLESVVRKLDAAVSKTVTKATTHVVCSEADYKSRTTKVEAGIAKGLSVLSPQWILDCEKERKKLDEVPFLWSAQKAPNGTNGIANGANGSNKKRPIAADTASDDEKPEPKKTKASKTKGSKENGSNAAPKDPEVAKEEKTVAEGQFAKAGDVIIPVDEFCPLTQYKVYVEPDTGLIWDASLNQSNSGRNNNKFYRLQVLHDPKTSAYKTWTRWGRVGEAGQNAILGDGALPTAIKGFQKKFREKTGLPWENRGDDPKPNKYAFVERSYDPDSDDEDDDNKADNKAPKKEDEASEEDDYTPPECTLEKPIQDLMSLIFNQQYFQATMSALNYDANKLPLGKLSKATITRGFQQLKDLAALINDPTLAATKWNMPAREAMEQLSNTYYSVIPHAFGRNRPPIISESTLLKKEVELLESLSDMKAAADIMKVDKKTRDTVHPLDSQFQGLGLEEMTTLDPASNEFSMLSTYLNDSRGSTHGITYNIQQIFRIERNGEKDRFEQSRFAKMPSDRRLLWHGSRCTNFGGILSQGLRIAPPEAPVSGYMFGKGIYLADMSSKSAGYCASFMSGNNALLLLCEAELGDPMQELTSASYSAGEDAKSKGMVSTWGKGRTGPSKWADAGTVHESLTGIKIPDLKVPPGDTKVSNASLYYNEYICYDVAQVKLRYLFRVKM